MPDSDFNALCAMLCRRMGVERDDAAGHDSGRDAMFLDWNGVEFLVTHSGQRVITLVDFGAVPAGKENAWQALLEINLLLRRRSDMSFARNPVDGRAILQCVDRFEGLIAERYCASLDQIAAIALQWRQGFFLDEKRQPQGPAAAAMLGIDLA